LRCQFDGLPEITLRAVPDSGAARTVLPSSAVPAGAVLLPSKARLRAANGTGFETAGIAAFTACIGAGPTVAIRAVVTPDLASAPLIGWRDLKKLGVLSHDFPSLGVDTLGPDGLGADAEDDGDDYYAEVNMVREDDPRSLGDGSDSLDKVKGDFADVLVTSLGDAAGSILGPRMHIELDASRNVKPLQITTARQVPIHIQPMAKRLME
jgi:hypothetical protein